MLFIPTQLFLDHQNYKGLIEASIAASCHKHTRPRRILIGLPYVSKPLNGDERRFPNLIQPMKLLPSKEPLILRKLYNVNDIGLILYADTLSTSYLKNCASSSASVMVMDTDWETAIYTDRMEMVPKEVAQNVVKFVPSVSEKLLETLHNNSDFRAMVCVPKIEYPDDLVRRVRDQEALVEKIRHNDEKAMKDAHVFVRRNTNYLDKLVTKMPSIDAFLPSAYMKEAVVTATRQISANIPSWEPCNSAPQISARVAKPIPTPPPKTKKRKPSPSRDGLSLRKKTKYVDDRVSPVLDESSMMMGTPPDCVFDSDGAASDNFGKRVATVYAPVPMDEDYSVT